MFNVDYKLEVRLTFGLIVLKQVFAALSVLIYSLINTFGGL